MYSKRRSSQELIKRTSSQHELSEEAFAPILPDEGAQKQLPTIDVENENAEVETVVYS